MPPFRPPFLHPKPTFKRKPHKLKTRRVSEIISNKDLQDSPNFQTDLTGKTRVLIFRFVQRLICTWLFILYRCFQVRRAHFEGLSPTKLIPKSTCIWKIVGAPTRRRSAHHIWELCISIHYHLTTALAVKLHCKYIQGVHKKSTQFVFWQ